MGVRNVLRNQTTLANLYRDMRYYYWKNLISDKKFITKRFRKRVGREVNLDSPVKYNDKLQWLKLNWYSILAVKCADKYEVREIIKDTIGENYLNEIHGVYESVEEIDINQLPNSFVLKGTHGSGFNIVCKDKSLFDWNLELKKMNRWLNTNYFWQNREWVYKDMKPRIIAEKYLSDENGKPPMDYKIFCFHGGPQMIQVDIDRFGDHKQNFYDINWNFRDIKIWCDNDKSANLPKPKGLNEMLEISRKLSKPFPHVRVDLYNIDGRILFGELTFFHQSGLQQFIDEKLEIEMGNLIKLEKINKDKTYIY